MRKIISVSLYNEHSKYCLGLLENIELWLRYYPDWIVRIYIEKNHYLINQLSQYNHVEIIEKEQPKGSYGMFWRFLAFGDSSADVVIVRDVDSRPTEREVLCVNEWLKTDICLHVIKDHEFHHLKPIMAGNFGIQKFTIENIEYLINNWPHTYEYGDDEKFLAEIIYPQFVEDIFNHDSSNISIPKNNTFIGNPTPTNIYIDRFIVLTAKNYDNRRKSFLKKIKESNILSSLNLEWWNGTDSSNRWKPSYWDELAKTNDWKPHYYFASEDHKDIIENLLLDNVSTALIMEDDAVPIKEFDSLLLDLWNNVPQDWLAIQLGAQSWSDYGRHHFNSKISIAKGCIGQHAVLWNRNGLKAFNNYLWKYDKDIVDITFSKLQKDSNKIYAPSKWITSIEGIQYGQDN
jgi:hypothetical protein